MIGSSEVAKEAARLAWAKIPLETRKVRMAKATAVRVEKARKRRLAKALKIVRSAGYRVNKIV